MMLAALGVVFGDIGTSPLYAFKETLHTAGQGADAAMGIASLIFWSVLLVIGIKYVLLVMSADNQGEGGTIALLSLALPAAPERWRHTVLVAGLAGASLFFGDAMITPAISVLSAVEGLRVVTPALAPYVVPIGGTPYNGQDSTVRGTDREHGHAAMAMAASSSAVGLRRGLNPSGPRLVPSSSCPYPTLSRRLRMSS